MIDERLTTSTAQTLMRSAGKNAKKAKPSIDAAAATVILEQALALERAGNVPGKRIEECR
jgi:putative Holliday junction resolvase